MIWLIRHFLEDPTICKNTFEQNTSGRLQLYLTNLYGQDYDLIDPLFLEDPTICKSTFLTEHLRATASVLQKSLWSGLLFDTQVSSTNRQLAIGNFFHNRQFWAGCFS